MGVRISNLTETTTMADANTLPTDTTSGTRRISWANIKTAMFGAINGLTSKSTPVGADVIAIGDSAASFAGKKATLSSLRSVILPIASFYANTGAGYGSSATKIMYFTNTPTNSPGTGFTVNNSATNGLSITINEAGLYSFSASFDTGGQYIGLSLNASSLTNDLGVLAAGEILAVAYVAGGGFAVQVAVTRRFAVNDVIRPHGAGTAISTASRCNFMCERIA